ncbi:hypothetical protein QUB80_22340 [Chlorogloeopsis sp. ULAP01]|uniref:hypothetical protein n=1 Tax=Chlorogloeopsis sp. ULAP01 TaxID=3056483 RepID=UPI0025AABBCF|nr:hypothetical protein [Chlorogloeopsis sp. ULAP01]MDM9383432.1 hypothetical protein [Chlorogloeopsis sp. ULAP01]
MTKMTKAMTYANLQELINKYGITDESVSKKAQEIGLVTPEQEEKAKQALFQKASAMHDEKVMLFQVSIESMEPINFQNFESGKQNQAQGTTTAIESQTSSTDKKDDDKNGKNEAITKDKKVVIANHSDVQQIIIPKLLEVLSNEGKPENRSIVYQGDKYTASIKLEDNSNTLFLDRNSDLENQEALVASKSHNDPSYSIIVNNITQEEFERFKLLFEKQNRHKQVQQQTQDSEKELE